MEDYKSNSNKSKQEKKVINKVVSGTVKSKKKSEVRKFADAFIQEDANSVKEYILMDVLIPAAKKAISDVVTNGIDMILYGETGRSKKKSGTSKVSYREYYEKNRDDRMERGSYRFRSGYDYDDIIIDNRGEAEKVLSDMEEIIGKYGVVSVADFYYMVDVPSSYTDNNYGWTDISSASVGRVRDGYLIKLPKALPID